MLRLAITLNINEENAQSTSYLVNGTHLGLHAPTPQNAHVQTSSRPKQMVVAVRDGDIGSAASMVRHRQEVSAWHEFLAIVSRRKNHELNHLLIQYNLFPDWMLLIDDQLMQAWLPRTLDLYLLRQGEMRRLKPAAAGERPPAADRDEDNPRDYYALQLDALDQLFVLPPVVLERFEKGEASRILGGLEQQPAKVRSLLKTARLRGYSEEVTWLAIQVQNLEPDYVPQGAAQSESAGIGAWLTSLFGPKRHQETRQLHSESVSLDGGDEPDEDDPPKSLMGFLVRTRPFKYIVAAGVLLIIAAVVLTRLIGTQAAPLETTESSASAQTTRPQATATPTNTPSPTPVPPQLVVSARQLNLRTEPSRDADLILTLTNGDRLWQLEEAADNWVKVKTENDEIGYVYFSYVEQISPTG